jgi:hypothetical protein
MTWQVEHAQEPPHAPSISISSSWDCAMSEQVSVCLTYKFVHRGFPTEDVISCFDGEGVGVGVFVDECYVQSKRIGYQLGVLWGGGLSDFRGDTHSSPGFGGSRCSWWEAGVEEKGRRVDGLVAEMTLVCCCGRRSVRVGMCVYC